MRVAALVKRIIIQNLRDKRTLALMMIVPLVLLTLVNFLFDSNDNIKLKVGVYGGEERFTEELEKYDLEIIKYSDKDNIEEKVIDENLSGFIINDNNKLSITYRNDSPSDNMQIKTKVVQTLSLNTIEDLKGVIQKINKEGVKADSNMSVEENYIYGDKDLTYFDTIFPIFIGFFVFFFVFLISGISLLKERTTKTLEKLLASPIKRHEILCGYLIGYGLFAVVQTIIVVLFSIYVLGIRIEGGIGLVILTNIIIAFVALSLGILLSTFANSEFQMMQFIPIVVVPQIFFAGIIPVDTMANWLQKIARFIPLYYGADALQGIVIKAYGFSEIKNLLLILLGFAVLFAILNIVGLKRYRKI